MSRWLCIDDICIPSDENDWEELVAFADAIAEQANNKTNTIVIEWNGEAHTISEWAKITGISRSTLNNRHWRGWDAERILTAPVTHGNQYTFYKAEREAKECHAT